jgi:hypothetical protein
MPGDNPKFEVELIAPIGKNALAIREGGRVVSARLNQRSRIVVLPLVETTGRYTEAAPVSGAAFREAPKHFLNCPHTRISAEPNPEGPVQPNRHSCRGNPAPTPGPPLGKSGTGGALRSQSR